MAQAFEVVVVAALALSLCGCVSGRTVALQPLARPPCATAAGSIAWFGPMEADDRRRLSDWCESVGGIVLERPTEGDASTDLSSRGLLVATWNVHEGAGDVERLITSLRQAGDPGTPPAIVVLVQEAVRAGDEVPLAYPSSVSPPRRIASSRPQRDIVDTARRLGLWLAYVPSMRNGEGRGAEPREDRGNAILSTLPLSDPIGIELPWVHQRRVAVMATVTGRLDGRPWRARLVSVHLDTRPRRDAQAASLATLLTPDASGAEPLIVGGDLNTWFGPRERTVRLIDRAVARVRECGDRPTFHLGRHMDDLFTTLPAAVRHGCSIADEFYGSDHRPTVLRLFR